MKKKFFMIAGVLVVVVVSGYAVFSQQGTGSTINMQDLPLFSPVAQTEQKEALSTREGWVTQKNLEVGIQIERPDRRRESLK